MKLFIFKRKADWDEFEGFAITAKTIESAVALREEASYHERGDWQLVFCEKVEHDKEEVLLEAYNAG